MQFTIPLIFHYCSLSVPLWHKFKIVSQQRLNSWICNVSWIATSTSSLLWNWQPLNCFFSSMICNDVWYPVRQCNPTEHMSDTRVVEVISQETSGTSTILLGLIKQFSLLCNQQVADFIITRKWKWLLMNVDVLLTVHLIIYNDYSWMVAHVKPWFIPSWDFLIHATKRRIYWCAQGLCLKNASNCTNIQEDNAV